MKNIMMSQLSGIYRISKSLLMAIVVAAPLYSLRAEEASPIVRGEYLAKVGDCIACHTAPRGKPFAGGLAMQTPLGKIYATNITPDPETGIGRYTYEEFDRAVRKGVAKDGRNLYPAMPYPSYAKVSADDIHALYEYFQKGVGKVRQPNRASDIPWPLNMRWPLIFWNWVFLDDSPYQTKRDKSAEWNRGAYLVQGLGHCGACHTARGIGFQEKALDERGKLYLGGAAVDNWFASNLTANHNSGLGRWTESDVAAFLRTGGNTFASAFGSMIDVINNSTQWLSDQDIRAISTYLKSLPAAHSDDFAQYRYDPQSTLAILNASAGNRGAVIYSTFCLHCHGANGQGYKGIIAPLAGNPVVMEADPVSLINVTLNGTGSPVILGVPAAYPMPLFHPVLSDREIAEVLTFVRTGWSNQARPVNHEEVGKIRKATR